MVERPSSEESIFRQALEIPSVAQRAAYLDAACKGNRQLRAGVDSLLQAHEKSQDLVDAPQPLIPPYVQTSMRDGPGTVIGPYKLLQQLGEGGMGTVFMAEQREPIERRVALKIIRPGMDTDQVITRFQAERQALALMEHPNIARVLDAGTTPKGRPFFVMELVKGIPINQYCDEHQLNIRQRLALFMPLCQAVQHAHQKGIIHRDLKPSNVLVADYDHTPVPKIIDFGVAKALSQRLTERTMFTQFGQVVGTLEYMSPEQAKLNQLDIDTRSDIYSLGVMLYELLTGTTPFQKELRSAAFDEGLRIIKEEEPPNPSTRLSKSETLPAIAANRKMEPTQLNRAVRGELDWIVMKCLEKERGRRYETASTLAADLERYLNDEPVQACPPSLSYRLKKLARRNRGPVLAALLVILTMVGGTAASIWQTVRATRAERDAVAGWADAELNAQAAAAAGQKADQARIEAEEARTQAQRAATRAEAVNHFLIESLLGTASASAHPGQKAMVSVLNNATRNLDRLFAGQTESEAAVRLTVGELYYSLRLPAEAEPHLQRGLDLRRATRAATLDPLKAEDAETLHAMKHLGQLLRARGDLARAEPLLRQSKEGLRRAQVRRIPVTEPDYFGWTYHVMTVAFSPDGRRVLASADDEGFRLYDVATGLEVHRFVGHEGWPMVGGIAPDGRTALSGSSDKTVRLWDLNTARELRQMNGHTEGISSVAFSPDGRQVLSGSADRTIRLWDLESGAEVQRLQGHTAMVHQAVFTPDARHILSGSADGTVRLWDVATGREARRLHDSKWSVPSVAVSPDGQRALSMNVNGVVHLWSLDSGEELCQLQGDSLGHVAFAPDGRQALITDHYRRRVRLVDLETGKDLKVFSVEMPLRPNGGVISADGRLAACGSWRGALFLWRLAPDLTLAEARQRLESARQDLGPQHADTLAALHDLAALLWEQDSPAEAAQLFRESLDAKTRALGTDHPETLFALRTLALFLQDQDRSAEAEPLLRRYLEGARRTLGSQHGDVLVALGDLSWLLRSQGRWAEAEPFLRARHEAWRRALGPDCIEVRGAQRSLAEALVIIGKPAEAESLHREQFERRQRAHPRGHPDVIEAQVDWCTSLIEMGQAKRAIAPLREILQILERDLGETDEDTVAAREVLGWALTEDGLAKEAQPLLTGCAELRRTTLPAGNWRRPQAESLLGRCLASLKQFDQAEPLLLASYNHLRIAPGCTVLQRLQALDRLIQLYEAWGKPQKAAQWRAKRPEVLRQPSKTGL
jgi:serine/threonine protein kinase